MSDRCNLTYQLWPTFVKLFGKSMLPPKFRARKLGEITVFYVVGSSQKIFLIIGCIFLYTQPAQLFDFGRYKPKSYFTIITLPLSLGVPVNFYFRKLRSIFQNYEFEHQKKHGVLKMINGKNLPLVNLKQVNITDFFNANNKTSTSK